MLGFEPRISGPKRPLYQLSHHHCPLTSDLYRISGREQELLEEGLELFVDELGRPDVRVQLLDLLGLGLGADALVRGLGIDGLLQPGAQLVQVGDPGLED